MKRKNTIENFHYNYRINFDCILGKGGFSTVYDGKSIKNKHQRCALKCITNGTLTHDDTPATLDDKSQRCAIKCITKGNLSYDDTLAIKEEASILQSLNHPNIIKLLDFYEEPNSFFIVTEKVAGGELFDRIVQKECYNEKTARDVMKAILNAVDYMHRKGIAHSDLKPENLLMVSRDNDAVLKLADFGFAARCDDDANNGFGNLSKQCGTPSYVAPEILLRFPYGTKADMWSVGIILYILLAGYPPFIEDAYPELFGKIIQADYEFEEEYWESISSDAKDLVRSLLEVNPKKRLSAKEALNSKWINSNDCDLEDADLTTSTFCNLKRFNAKRKLRAAVHSLIAVNRLRYLSYHGRVLK